MKKFFSTQLCIILWIIANFTLASFTVYEEPFTIQERFFNLQDQGPIQKRSVVSLKKAIDSRLSSDNPILIKEGERLKSLAEDLNPTIYLISGNLSNPSGTTALCIETDMISLSKLYELNPDFNSVEYLQVKLTQPEEMSMVLNPDNFKSLINLKYICFSCSFPICSTSQGCEASYISQMVAPSEENTILLLYEVTIPE